VGIGSMTRTEHLTLCREAIKKRKEMLEAKKQITELKSLDGRTLALLLNSLDFEIDYELIMKIEDEMEFRYEDWYINLLLRSTSIPSITS